MNGNTIYGKLLNIQQALKAPKNQYNTFGKYYYRSCEDILEGLKPLLRENNCVLLLNDDAIKEGDRYYISAQATLIDAETGESVMATAYAREAENKKGMDESQVSGSTSSYARKYALNGLFCIDDVKDADATQGNGNEKPIPQNEPEAPKQSNSSQTTPNQCTACGATMTKAQVTLSEKKYGNVLCRDCQQKLDKAS